MPYALFGFVAGGIATGTNRKIALAITIALCGASMGLSGICNSFIIIAAMRVVHGMLSATTNPLSFSLIQNCFQFV